MIWLLLACRPSPDLDTASPKRDTDRESDTDTDTDTDADTDADTDTDTDTDSSAERSLHLGIPAYVWPADPTFPEWVEGAVASGGLVVANPASGPGTERVPAYVNALAAIRTAGATVIGYVHTSYGARDAAVVDAEVAAWRDLYGVDGIFFDEVSSDCTTVDWYAARAAAADAADTDGDAFVAYNPGVASCEGFLGAADLLVVAEDEGADLAGWTAPAWTASYSPDRFWLLAHTADAAQMTALLATARAQNVGWIYVTDDVLANPWDALPSYWEAERAGVE